MVFTQHMPNIIPPKTPIHRVHPPLPVYIYPRPINLLPYVARLPPKPFTIQESSSIAKKVTDDLFASSTFCCPKTMPPDKYCGFLKDQLKKCAHKHETCVHIKNIYDDLC